MGKQAVLLGATGMVGNIVLKHLLQSDDIDRVITIGRRPTEIQHDKLVEHKHADFMDFSSFQSELAECDVAYFCIGVYTGAVNDSLFKKITFDFSVAFGDAYKAANPKGTVCFLSGAGADQSEKSKVAFAKYKGMAENHLIGLDFLHLNIFRPGYIYPSERREEPNLMYRVSRSLYPLLKLFGPKYSITSNDLGEAMFLSGLYPSTETVLENADILEHLSSHRALL